MYGFTEVRSHNHRYIISSIIGEVTNKPDKLWTALQINDKNDKEVAYWDNPAWLKSVLLVNLERYVSGSISRKQFLDRTNTEQPKEVDTETVVVSIQEARELLELFQWARKLKMI